MSNSSTKMDVDNPSVLKRSSSAPMINDLSPTMTTSSSTVTTQRESTSFNFFTSAQTRTRRYSASCPLQTPGGLSPRLTPRVNQLRQEECIDAAGREVAHERELHSAMVMSQSWEDLRLVGDPPSKDDKQTENSDTTDGNNGNNNKSRFCDPLQLNLQPCSSPAGCSSPSPTRMLFRQTFSPTTQWKTLSPSPTRKQSYTTRRSSSPIAMRPSSLVPVKRKFEMDDSEPPAKRAGGLLIAQSRLDVSESPVTGSLSSVGTPESISSGDSPSGFMDTPSALIDHPMQDLAKADPSPS